MAGIIMEDKNKAAVLAASNPNSKDLAVSIAAAGRDIAALAAAAEVVARRYL